MMTPNNCNIGRELRALSGYGRLTPWHGIVYARSYDAAKPHKNSLSNHWSSTENSTNNSWNMNFNDGNANNNNKYNANVVRPAVAHPTKAWLQLRKTIQIAYLDCCRGKRNGRQYQDYLSIANEDLDLLTTELMEGTYKPSTSTCFLVKFPKLREVFAAAFRDRIIHHWMCLRLVPLFEELNHNIGNVTHNCRIGYGTKSAVNSVYKSINKITYSYGREAYIFKGDLVGFFMSLPQRRLCDKLKEFTQSRYHGDFKELLLWLIEVIVMHRPERNCMLNSNPEDWTGLAANKSLFRTGNDRGAPIGNLTTQLYANFYMTDFDAYMMDHIKKLREQGTKCSYDRFVDDFVLVSSDKKALKHLIKCAETKIEEMDLTMHKDKRYFQPASHGVMFVGSYLKNGRIYLSNRTIGRFKDKVNQIRQYLSQPSATVTSADLDHILATLNSYLGFCKDKKTFRLRRKIMRPLKYLPEFCKYYSVNDQMTKVTLKKRHKTIIT